MVFLGPIFHGLHDIAAYHRPLRSGLITTAGGIRIASVRFMTVEVTGDGQAEIRPVTHKGMIVNHVHDHTDTIPVQSPHHLLELTDTSLGIVRIGGIAPLGGVIVLGIIPPIVHIILQAGLVHRAIIIGRKDMDMGNAQLLQMIHAGSHAARPFRALLRQGEKLTFMRHAGVRGDREIPMMHLVDDNIGEAFQLGRFIRLPALRIGSRPIDHGRTVSIHPDGFRPDTGSLIQPFIADTDLEGIEGAFQILAHGDTPRTLVRGFHRQLADRLPSLTGGVKIQADFFRRRGPKGEHGFRGRIEQLQIVSLIGRVFIKGFVFFRRVAAKQQRQVYRYRN